MKKIINRLLCFGFLVQVFACGNQEQELKSTGAVPQPAKVTQVIGIGKIEPLSGLMDLATDESGRIVKVHKKEGDSLKKGELIVSLDADDEKFKVDNLKIQLARQQEMTGQAIANIKQIEAELEQKKSELLTSEELVRYGAETRQNVEIQKKDVDVLRAQYQAAKKISQSNLLSERDFQNQISQEKKAGNDRSIRAKTDGILVSFDAKQGDVLDAFTVFGQMAPNEEVVIHGEVDELFAGKVKLGQSVSIVLSGSDQKLGEGKIISLSPILQNKSLFYDEPGEVSDRRVRRFKVAFNEKTSVLINKKVECIIHL